MRDHEIIELYCARNESAITATAEKYGKEDCTEGRQTG